MKKTLQLIVFLPCLFIVGCGSTIRSNVSAFHEMPNNWTANTIKILPFDAAMKSSLEWKSYKGLIEAELKKKGIRLVGDDEKSDYIAFASYGIDSGQTSSTNMPLYGQTGGGSTFSSGTVYGSGGGSAYYSGSSYTMPTYGVVGSIPIKTTTYQRNFALDIVVADSLNGSDVKKLYEGRVSSRGSCGNLSTIVPAMVTSLFKEFPGAGGGNGARIDLPWDGSC
ncbi:MAG: DUF4136 domain-containing protein [Nitrospina sp.]|jgi:hypothetical protein|nr:DUF4136 domain-containing protein [Nitrospina sp.]